MYRSLSVFFVFLHTLSLYLGYTAAIAVDNWAIYEQALVSAMIVMKLVSVARVCVYTE
jgi:hypothetical protein